MEAGSLEDMESTGEAVLVDYGRRVEPEKRLDVEEIALV